MSFYFIFAYSTGGALILLMLLGIAFSAFLPSIDKWNKRYLITLFSLQFVCIFFSYLDAIFYTDSALAEFERVIYFISFLSISVLMIMPTIFLLHYCNENIKESLLFKEVMVVFITSLIILIIIQFTDVFYYVTPENEFIRGPLFPMIVAPTFIIIIFNIIGVLRRRKKLPKRTFITFLIYLPPLAVATFVHMFTFFELFIVLGMGLWALTILAIVTADNSEQFMRQQREIANQRASIMVLQMRPHFIYNTMTSIYYLCDQDAQKAKQVTLDFTTYLRKNFAAIASEEPIPFTEELEHTRAYLAVEQAQFEDSLFVKFDTPFTEFSLPPLTLQPIVENAVKHGMVSCNDPIHISVATVKTDKAIEIIVEDDGPGFKPTDNNDPHIALNNIRERLAIMCSGTLNISARSGGGTMVKLILPYRKQARE